ncbi:nitrous oxide reductase accessory protein NosL [Halorubrum alkaliphilum]|uniref:Nitrous oxide reductase accessory protein NosL n=1 Tax=Halorubrum alkaliphilum TaxID=261290 RepID=A0A8T4GDB5_9EURY|nr:nitrous oxide reductase accessory protein NosL [Halorubrum alkaliphilum]MBP1922103.1 nitrous oxide reductase accessory protein NosL [Halorubrum alkaliphilum]
MAEYDDSDVNRRTVLTGVSTGMALAVAGCLGGEGDPDIEPIALDGERSCDQCGMIVEDHPGPVGQIHFADDEPEGGRPGQFCSSSCTYRYRFDEEDAGREPLVTFLTDYSRVDQEAFEEGSDVLFSSHVESEAFASTAHLTVVAGSDVVGSMGPELIPFSDSADVDSFQETYGGQEMDAGAVDRTVIEGL